MNDIATVSTGLEISGHSLFMGDWNYISLIVPWHKKQEFT
jgi:hypothetical protein